MKWKDFKKRVEDAGIKDDDELWYIDISFDDPFEIEEDELGWKIA